MTQQRLLIIEGQEGAGKTTTLRALVKAVPNSARIDAEDVADVNPWQMDDAFIHLMWKNVAQLTHNFWDAGYGTVIAGSFLSNTEQYAAYRKVLDRDAETCVVQLCATKPTRDHRRIHRGKETSEEWRDMVDRVDPEDTTFSLANADFRFHRIDNDGLDIDVTVDLIRTWAPELFATAQAAE